MMSGAVCLTHVSAVEWKKTRVVLKRLLALSLPLLSSRLSARDGCGMFVRIVLPVDCS